MDEEILLWINRLIRDNSLHQFYASPMWRRMQSRVLKRDHYECQRCRAKGKVTRANTVHHRKYLRDCPQLALDEDNLESICEACHYEEHHRKKPGFMNEERW